MHTGRIGNKTAKVRLPLLFLALFAFPLSGFTATPFVHQGTGITLPETLAGLTLREIKSGNFRGEPAIYTSYSGPQSEVAIFIRLFDPATESTPLAIVKSAFDALPEMQKSGIYSDVRIIDSPTKIGNTDWATVSFAGKNRGTPATTFIFATIKGSYSVKLCVTTANPKDPTIPAFFSEFQNLVKAAPLVVPASGSSAGN